MLGTAPVLGRTFRDEEMRPGGNPVAILSHRLWQQRFGAQESILGRTLVLDGRPRSIIGVMPAECRFPSSNTAFWIPLVIDPTDSGDLWGRNVWTVGRLRSGVSIERARAEVRAFTPILRSIFPSRAFAQDWGQEADVIPLHERRVGDVRRTLMVFLAAVGSVM